MAQRDMTEVTCGLTNTLRSVPAKFHNDCRYQAVTLKTPGAGVNERYGDLSPVDAIAYQLAWITSCLPTIHPESSYRFVAGRDRLFMRQAP